MTTPHLESAAAPLAFLQLTGHPVRWRLLEELARSDRMVHELTGLVGEPQNLVSYHLAKLRDGRLVSARRSAADGRDSYYTADLARIGAGLSEAGGALHPALHLAAPARTNTLTRSVKILFLCTGNSARSPMAEALARARSGGAIKAVSAGSEPKPLHPNAVKVMRAAHGLDIAHHNCKRLDALLERRFDFVISLCDRVREVCPEFPGGPAAIHWSIPNPATGAADETTYPLFEQTAAELATRIDFLLGALSQRAPGPAKRRSSP